MNLSSFPVVIRLKMLVALICLTAFVFYQALIHLYPAIYWGDGHVRLALRDQILVGHWLPLLQSVIWGVSKVTGDIVTIRIVLSIIALGTLVVVYWLGGRLFSPVTGLIAMVFLASNQMFVALAIVPYTEVLFMGLVGSALYLMDNLDWSPKFYLGGLALGLACVTRYEGWLLAAVFMVEVIGRSFRVGDLKRFISEVFKITCLCGTVPLAWLLFGVKQPGGLIDSLKSVIAFEAATGSQSLTDRLLSSINVDYLQAFVSNYYRLVEWQVGLGIVLLGICGWFLAMWFASRGALHWRILAFIVLDWLLLAFWQPQNFTDLRTPFIAEVFLILYAAHGLQKLAYILFEKLAVFLRRPNLLAWQNWGTAGVMLVTIYISISAAANFVAVSSHESDFYIPAQAGIWLRARMTDKDAIWVLNDEPFQTYALAAYTPVFYNNILDDRFDIKLIDTRLAFAQKVYAVGLYKSKDGLSHDERILLTELESGRIPSQHFLIGETNLWVVAKNLILFP